MDHTGDRHAVQLSEPASDDDLRQDHQRRNGEHWVAELLTNPSVLARAGWTKGRSLEALKPGTRVKLYVGTSRAGGFSGIVMKIENEQGENIVGDRADAKAVDLDGAPGGLQPAGEKKLPGQTAGQ